MLDSKNYFTKVTNVNRLSAAETIQDCLLLTTCLASEIFYTIVTVL